MALDREDEILQDFLVEADEILEGLNEQLVALETQPQNSDLLNSIFRGFHTIKGGAGFLSLDAMVALCHKGEDVFNILRQGDRVVDAEMMDTFLKVLDILNVMFEETKAGEYPSPADPDILNHLATYLAPAAAVATVVIAVPEPVIAVATTNEALGNDDITDEEFEALLNQLHGDAAPGTVAPSPVTTPE
jgi:two-component system chemotaxis sensor kinase CheA